MGRIAGTWLEGPQLPRDKPPGVRLGLPADGPGSVASFGARLLAFLVDAVVANLLAGVPYLFGVRYSIDGRGLAILGAFALEEFVLVAAAGQTVGMRLLGLRVIRVRDGGQQTVPWIAVRTLLLALLIPAFVWDRDQRGTHDRAAGTVVVREPKGHEPARSPVGTAAARRAAARDAGHSSGGSGASGTGQAAGRSGSSARPRSPARPGTAVAGKNVSGATGGQARGSGGRSSRAGGGGTSRGGGRRKPS